LQLVHDGFGRETENWTCWEFIQSSCLQNWKLGHDCRRVSTHSPIRLKYITRLKTFQFFFYQICRQSQWAI